MALSPDDAQARSELLIRDAEEDLARERLHLFWKNWGSTIIGMAVMLVVGTAAGVAWREWRQDRDEASTQRLLQVAGNITVPMTEDAAREMTDDHAAIGWLVKAGTVSDTATPEQRAELAKYYDAAGKSGDGSAWGLLARWNTLRLRMDDESADAKALIKEFDDLAADMGKSELAALPATDAAVLAGERLKDPKRALEYLKRAEQIAPRSSPMSVTIADLKHLYEIRAQEMAQGEGSQ